MTDPVDNKRFPAMNKNGLPFIMTHEKSEIGDNEGKDDGFDGLNSGCNDLQSDLIPSEPKYTPTDKLKLNESIYKIFYSKRGRKDEYGHSPIASSMVSEIKNKNFQPLYDANNHSDGQKPQPMSPMAPPTIPILFNSPLTQKDQLSGMSTPRPAPHRADHNYHHPRYAKESPHHSPHNSPHHSPHNSPHHSPHNSPHHSSYHSPHHSPHHFPHKNMEQSLPKAMFRSKPDSAKFLPCKTMARAPPRKPPTLSESLKKGQVICVVTPFAKQVVPVSPPPPPNHKKVSY